VVKRIPDWYQILFLKTWIWGNYISSLSVQKYVKNKFTKINNISKRINYFFEKSELIDHLSLFKMFHAGFNFTYICIVN